MGPLKRPAFVAAALANVAAAGGCTSTYQYLTIPSDQPEDWGFGAIVVAPFVVVYVAAREVFEFMSQPAPWDRD